MQLYIYGYLNRVRSSRRLEGKVLPQHRGHLAAADFEARFQDSRRASGAIIAAHSNQCFGSSYCCAVKLDLYGAELLAVDGARIKAVNSKDRNFAPTRSRSSCARRTSAWKLISSGSTRGMSRKTEQAAARGTNNLAEKIAALRATRTLWGDVRGA